MQIDRDTYRAQAKNGKQRFLILHYTALNFRESMRALTSDKVSAHYVVPAPKTVDATYPHDELTVYAPVPETERAWHAGASAWGDRTHLNDTSIGIEIVNLADENGFAPYPEEQIDVLIELCRDILARHPDITPERVLGHGDIAAGRKQDPGPLFPWRKLHDAGIGAWFDQTAVARYQKRFAAKMPTAEQVHERLYRYGYRYAGDFKTLLQAFQMHFRPADYSGLLDAETAAIVYAMSETA